MPVLSRVTTVAEPHAVLCCSWWRYNVCEHAIWLWQSICHVLCMGGMAAEPHAVACGTWSSRTICRGGPAPHAIYNWHTAWQIFGMISMIAEPHAVARAAGCICLICRGGPAPHAICNWHIAWQVFLIIIMKAEPHAAARAAFWGPHRRFSLSVGRFWLIGHQCPRGFGFHTQSADSDPAGSARPMLLRKICSDGRGWLRISGVTAQACSQVAALGRVAKWGSKHMAA